MTKVNKEAARDAAEYMAAQMAYGEEQELVVS